MSQGIAFFFLGQWLRRYVFYENHPTKLVEVWRRTEQHGHGVQIEHPLST